MDLKAKTFNNCLTIFVTTCLLISAGPIASHAGPSSCPKLLSFTKTNSFRKKLQFYNPFNIFNGRRVHAVELLGQSFYAPSERGAVVGISGYSGLRASLNQANADFLSGKMFADGKSVFHFDVDKPSEFIDKLMEVYSTSGSIFRLSIMGHGSPGSIELGSEKLTRFWSFLYQSELRSLPDDLFVKDAEIVILSCNCARGTVIRPNRGINQIKSIFSKIARNGAKIIASRQSILADTEGFEESSLVEEVRINDAENFNTDNFLLKVIQVPLALVVLPTMWANNIYKMIWLDHKSKFEPIAVIDLPPESGE